MSPAATQAKAPATSGFHWNDAGIGAAAMLGIVLVVGGLGAAFLLTRTVRREPRRA